MLWVAKLHVSHVKTKQYVTIYVTFPGEDILEATSSAMNYCHGLSASGFFHAHCQAITDRLLTDLDRNTLYLPNHPRVVAGALEPLLKGLDNEA